MVINKKYFLMLILLVLFSSLVLAQENNCVYYFYGQGCPHCGQIKIYLDGLQEKYPDLQINRFEIYYNKSNHKILQGYFDNYEIPLKKQGIPVVFLPKTYFIGSTSIENFLESALLNNNDQSCPTLNNNETLGIIGAKSPKNLIETLTFLTVTGAALVDSINPCALAVLLILLGALLTVKSRKRLLGTGFAFIASIYLAYLLFGLGIMATLSFIGISYYFYKVVGVIAIIIGLFNIKDYFWYGKVILMEIPLKWRPKLKKLLQGVTSVPGAFLLGFLVTLFELPCTGGPYLVILGLLAEQTTKWTAMPLLLYYNLIFVLPLIVITLVIAFNMKKISEHGKGKEHLDVHGNIEKWRQKNLRLLHLIAGIIMVILGLIILFFL